MSNEKNRKNQTYFYEWIKQRRITNFLLFTQFFLSTLVWVASFKRLNNAPQKYNYSSLEGIIMTTPSIIASATSIFLLLTFSYQWSYQQVMQVQSSTRISIEAYGAYQLSNILLSRYRIESGIWPQLLSFTVIALSCSYQMLTCRKQPPEQCRDAKTETLTS